MQTLIKAMVESGLIITFAEGRRLIQNGGVQVNGERVNNVGALVQAGDVIKVGKIKQMVVK